MRILIILLQMWAGPKVPPSLFEETMTEQEYTKLVDIYRDKNYMVNPNQGKENSDNGLYFSALDEALRAANGFGPSNVSYKFLVNSCFKKPGLLMRNPQNTNQEQFDDFIGVTLGCLMTGNESLLREILMYGATHFFVFNTDDKLEFRDWLGRFVQVWLTMTAVAYPITKYPLYPAIALSTVFMNPTERDQSGNLLQYSEQSIIRKLYNTNYFFDIWYKKLLAKVPEGMSEVMRQYFGDNHPFTKVIKENNKY